MRCRSCSALRSSTLYRIHPARFVLGMLAGLLAGVVAGAVLQFGFGLILYLLLFAAPVAGRFVGDVIVSAVGRKRGLSLEIMTGVTICAGAAAMLYLSDQWRMWLHSPTMAIVDLLALALLAGSAIARIRYQ